MRTSDSQYIALLWMTCVMSIGVIVMLIIMLPFLDKLVIGMINLREVIVFPSKSIMLSFIFYMHFTLTIGLCLPLLILMVIT